MKIGGIGPGDFTYEIPKILEFALGLPIQVVAGYKGTAPIRLAVESGEVDGVCMDWNSIKATWRRRWTAVTSKSSCKSPRVRTRSWPICRSLRILQRVLKDEG